MQTPTCPHCGTALTVEQVRALVALNREAAMGASTRAPAMRVESDQDGKVRIVREGSQPS